jgi:hypothetical protein
MGTPGFAGELTTRHFNLTHELGHGADLLPGTVADGFSGLVLLPTCLLTFFLRDDWLAGMAAFRVFAWD